MEAEYLMPMSIVQVGSPELLNQRSGLANPKDLSKYTLLHEVNYEQWGEWLAARGLDTIDSSRGIVCQDSNMFYNLALNGQGIALVTEQVMSEELSSGRLVRLVSDSDESTDGYYLVYRKDVRLSPRAQIYREFVLKQAQLPNQ
jgi:LysR family glycine cleavage system transcriptional activator